MLVKVSTCDDLNDRARFGAAHPSRDRKGAFVGNRGWRLFAHGRLAEHTPRARPARSSLAAASRWACVAAVCSAIGCGGASTPPTPEVIVAGLNNPTGVAVLDGGTLIVAESGAGRLISLAADGTTEPLVSNFALGTFSPYDIGPLAVLALPDGTLIVGEGGAPFRERVSFFSPEGVSLSELDMTPLSGGNFSGLAIDPATGDLYIAGADTDNIFVAVALEGGLFDDPVEFIADTKLAPIGWAAPSALAFDVDGTLLVGFSGSKGSGIVRLAPANQQSTPFVEQVYSSTRMVTALAVRPSDGVIFFAEFDLLQTTPGRVATITETGDEPATYLENLAGPSALIFDSTENLFIATLGTTPNGDAGSILKVAGKDAGEPDEPNLPEPVEDDD
ncbi:MAG: hypothetical protein IID39_09470 [Planctomycetes bacterium]|nr:hypothetical protein [Planctomycetota bacterium]